MSAIAINTPILTNPRPAGVPGVLGATSRDGVDWNTPSIRFYQKLDAKLRRQWILTRLTGAPLSRLARHRAANRS